jgi:UDP-glucose 4-epimerase
MNIAIIGSNGFIGSHLAFYLSKNKNYRITLFDRSAVSLLNGLDSPYFQLTTLDSTQFETIFSKIDVVYYLASATIPSTSWDDPKKEIEGNLLPFLSFMNQISSLTVRKVVYVSSAGTIYGPSDEKVNEEADKHPFSPYGIVKLTMENFLNYFKIRDGVSFDIYRISNVFGEGQNTSKGLGIINTFLENILSKNEVHVYGDGNNVRNYIYVNDVVKLMEHSVKGDLSVSEIYNLASNDNISINKLIEIMKNILPDNFEVKYTESRKSDNSKIILDNTKIVKANHGFEFISIEKAIKNIYEFIRKGV